MNITPEWFTGFAEGEAAFTFSRFAGCPRPWFSIRLHERNEALMKGIVEFLKVGSMYHCRSRLPTQDSVYFRVSRKNELPIIVHHFDSYPCMGDWKRIVYGIWRRLVMEFLQPNPSLPELISLARTLTANQSRPRGFVSRLKTVPSDLTGSSGGPA